MRSTSQIPSGLIALGLAGTGLALAGVLSFVLAPLNRQNPTIYSPIVVHDRYPFSVEGDQAMFSTLNASFGMSETRTALLSIDLNAPVAARVDEAVAVHATISVPEDIAQYAHLEQVKIALSGTGAGVEIKPSDYVSPVVMETPTRSRAEATWSIAGARPGKAVLVVNIDSSQFAPLIEHSAPKKTITSIFPSFDDEAGVRVLLARNPQVSIKFNTPWYSFVQTAWPVVASIGGSFLTVPGLVAFWQNRKKAAKANHV